MLLTCPRCAPLQALRSKSFLEFASQHALKTLQALKQRKALAAWVAAADAAASDTTPGGTAVGAPLPWCAAYCAVLGAQRCPPACCPA